jgi:hypothetical protein
MAKLIPNTHLMHIFNLSFSVTNDLKLNNDQAAGL